MQFSMSRCLEAFSLALDCAEQDYLKVSRSHSRRVAYLATEVGRALSLPEPARKDLYLLSLLHDNGITVSAATGGRNPELMPGHCDRGQENVASVPLFGDGTDVIRFHHENHDGTGVFGVSGADIPLLSQVIHLADSLDTRFDLVRLATYERGDVRRHVSDNSGTLFSPDVAEAFLSMSHRERLWSDLAFPEIGEILRRVAPQIVLELSWKEILPISRTFMKIIDSKSKFTFLHSEGIAAKVALLAESYGLDEEKQDKLAIAASLHDCGKLFLPKTLLESPASIDVDEHCEIRKHAYYTRLVLDKIPGFEEIAAWAGNHHEKLNGKGYPDGLAGDALDFESRLMAVVDMYQALSEDRPYRRALSHGETVSILHDLANEGFISGEIARDVDILFGGTQG